MSSLLTHPPLHHASFILPISFQYAPVLFRLTYFSPDISSSLIFCHRCDFAVPLVSSLRRRASPAHHYCSEHPAHCPSLPHFFPPGSRNETGASCTLFIIFHTSRSLFGPPWWWCYHLLPPTHHPHRLPSASWSEGGRGISVTLLILWCFRQFWEADGRRSLSERSWCARDGGRETVTVGRHLSGFSGCFLESEQRGNTRKRNEKEEQKRIGTNERMGFLRLSAFPLKGLYI